MRKKVRGSNVSYTNKHTHVKQKKKERKKNIYIYKDQDYPFQQYLK